MNEAVLDAGPLIHLEQVQGLQALDFVENKLVSHAVKSEIGSETFDRLNAEVLDLEGEAKDKAKYLKNRYGIEMGEASALALCQQEGVKLFLTDDLDARDAAKSLGFEPHGTMGIVTRSYSEDYISEDEAKRLITSLRDNSSLFITSDLVEWALDRIEKS